MKHDPEVNIFYSDRNRYISQEFLTPHVAVNFLSETKYMYFDKSHGFPTLEVQYSKILSLDIDSIG